ncbi:glycosyltransferase [Luteimonas sp. TWI1416]|uniref:glycosyltransferase family protein n=1 Tax=unclassified Luteimonas TaxID=2629088 RepID=UPI003209C26C
MNIIFHTPLPLAVNPVSASGIRPMRMIDAFSALGHKVDVVSGHGRERAKAIGDVKKKIRNGTKYALAYSESSTMPTLLTERHHLPTRPCLDFGFFKHLNDLKVPIGLFYRDIYWAFPEYEKNVGALRAKFARFFYRYDLQRYNSQLDMLYVPSIRMVESIPSSMTCPISELPPGHDFDAARVSTTRSGVPGELRLLYIGGLSSHYQMHELFSAVSASANTRLVVCTRDLEWHSNQSAYAPYLSENIEIVHASGEGLNALYDRSDIALVFVKPHAYWTFAAPVKLYEYLGRGTPIIASKGTLAAEFVEANKVGWVIPYTSDDLSALLRHLSQNPDEIERARQQCLTVLSQHSWKARAAQVINDLAGA